MEENNSIQADQSREIGTTAGEGSIFETMLAMELRAGCWHGKKAGFMTPESYIQLETLYATSEMTMKECAVQLSDNGQIKLHNSKKRKIEPEMILRQWAELTLNHQGVRTIHREAKRIKAEILGDSALSLYRQELPETAFKEDLYNDKILLGAGVQYQRDKHNALLKHAELLERGQYADKEQERTKAGIVAQNVTINLSEIMKKPLSELITLQDDGQ